MTPREKMIIRTVIRMHITALKIIMQVGLHDMFIDTLSCYVYNSTLATWHLLHNFMSIPSC